MSTRSDNWLAIGVKTIRRSVLPGNVDFAIKGYRRSIGHCGYHLSAHATADSRMAQKPAQNLAKRRIT
jgi:hypothetical protein